MMKDLKHYFASPKESGEHPICDILKESCHSEDEVIHVKANGDADHGSSSKAKPKKKKRKRKLAEEPEFTEAATYDVCIVEEPTSVKKRKKSVDVLKSKNVVPASAYNGEVKREDNKSEETACEKESKVSKRKVGLSNGKKKRDSGSSKENSSSDLEEKECSTPEPSKSLLSYFSKVDKLPEIPEKPRIMKVEVLIHADSTGPPPSLDSSGRKPRRSTKKQNKKKGDVIDFDLITTEELPTDRSSVDCSLPPKLINSDDTSKQAPQDVVVISDGSSDSESTKPSKATKEEADSVISVKQETSKEKPKVKHDGTLASFFNLGNRPPPIPYEQKVAKQLFLKSSAPKSLKRVASNSNSEGSIAPFPTKSHIQQKDRMNILWNLNTVKFDFVTGKSKVKCPPWSSVLEKTPKIKDNSQKPCESFDNKTALKDLKKELNLFPIGCWQKELKKMKKGGDDCLWTERYRPHSASAFLANTRSISKLKAWLSELMESSNSESAGSSGDEFVQDGDESKSERKTVALLTGPPGTGKTAAVYAVAEEVGYNVLEINASSNRSGKRILNEFSEAMKSHKVGVSKLNFSKVKKKTEDPKRNLILIEDADLLFDDDEGFVPMLLSLGAGTKRPIILVANNPQAKHFAKLSTLFHATLPFVPPTQDRLGSWLRTVSIVEGFQLGKEESEKLASSLDLRKSLLQLQLSQSHPKANMCLEEAEKSTWERAGEIDLSSSKGRKIAKRVISVLTSIDLIRQKQVSRKFPPYWYKPPEDSTLNIECIAEPPPTLGDIEGALLRLATTSLPPASSSHHYEIPKCLSEVEKDACHMTSALNRRSIALDFWPALRQISRTETKRLASHTKRNNRYFNYLGSLGVKGPPDFMQSLSSAFTSQL